MSGWVGVALGQLQYRWLVKNSIITSQTIWSWTCRCCQGKWIFHVPCFTFVLLISSMVTASILVPPGEFPPSPGREYKAIYSNRISFLVEGYIKPFSQNTPRTLEAFILDMSSVLDKLLEPAGSSRWPSVYLLNLPWECSQIRVCSNAF